MNSVNLFLQFISVLIFVSISESHRQINAITDFRYSSARIDAITKLPNNTLFVVSNGYYWVLNDRQTPRTYNVIGHVSQLYPKFKTLDAIFTDPINEVDPKIYLVSHSSRRGIRVACQEFDGQYDASNTFCHLPVNKKWYSALKDLDLTKPIDAATWRNRSKDKDEGFWAFFQGKKMTVIDPYKMELRFTYDIHKWMAINETITATYYDYQTHSFHLFFNNNKYRIWKVNVSLMNSLPMGWDRAFLHGSLSEPLKINRDFFKFYERELRDYEQPNFEPEIYNLNDEEDEEDLEEEKVEDKIENKLENKLEKKLENKLENKLDIKLESINKKDVQFVTDISNDLENNHKTDNEFSGVHKNQLYQQSDEAAVRPVISNSGLDISFNPFIYYFVFIFYTFYRFQY